MPVRIYDISKKLGLENKEVLAKAKELGITAAKVASSSLDKITAEYLENELTGGKPVAAAAPAAPSAPESIIVVKSPPQPAVAPPPARGRRRQARLCCASRGAEAGHSSGPQICRARERRDHQPQPADCGAGAGGPVEAQAVSIDRGFDGAGRFCERQPGH